MIGSKNCSLAHYTKHAYHWRVLGRGSRWSPRSRHNIGRRRVEGRGGGCGSEAYSWANSLDMLERPSILGKGRKDLVINYGSQLIVPSHVYIILTHGGTDATKRRERAQGSREREGGDMARWVTLKEPLGHGRLTHHIPTTVQL